MERGVEVCEPDGDQLSERDRPVRDPAGLASEPVARGLEAAIHSRRGELVREGQEGRVERVASDATLEPAKRIDHDPRVAAFAKHGEDEVRDLVDDAHCIQRARVHQAVGVTGRVPNGVHPMREVAARGQIDDDHVRRHREQPAGEPVVITRRAGDVELER